MRVILLCGAGPSYGATLDVPYTRWAVNWRGNDPKPDLVFTADHVFAGQYRESEMVVPCRRIWDQDRPYIRGYPGQHGKQRLGFSGPNALWFACLEADLVVLTGFELYAAGEPHTTALYMLQMNDWGVVSMYPEIRNKTRLHPGMTSPLKQFYKVLKNETAPCEGGGSVPV